MEHRFQLRLFDTAPAFNSKQRDCAELRAERHVRDGAAAAGKRAQQYHDPVICNLAAFNSFMGSKVIQLAAYARHLNYLTTGNKKFHL